MQDMKLLMENWRKYSSLMEESKDLGSIFLFENKRAIKQDFSVLLEQYDNGKITSDELYECWYQSVLHEHKILNEGFGDMMKKTGAAIKGAWDKLNDWVLKKTLQLYNLAQRGIEKTVQGAKVLIDKAADFKSEHPIAFKVATVVALSIAMFALMSALDADQAQAAIKTPGLEGGMAGDKISDTAYETLRGLVDQSKEAGLGGEGVEMRTRAMRMIDAAQAAGETVDFSTLKTETGQFANKQLQLLDYLVQQAREGDKEASDWLKKAAAIGKKAVYSMSGVPTR